MTGPISPLDALRQRVTDDDGYLPSGRAEDVDAVAWASFLGELQRSGWPVTRGDGPSQDWPRRGRAGRKRGFSYGLEIHRRTANLLGKRVPYGRASGPRGTPRRFSTDFRFGRGCYGNHGRIGVELKTRGGRLVTYSGAVR